MTAGPIEFEIEQESVVVLDLAVLAPAAEQWRCKCGAVTLGDDVAHRVAGCRPIERAAVTAVAYPVPEVTSREPWDGAGTPSAVLKLAEKARAASWDVRVQRSRGSRPHATHGAPGAVKWLYALVLGNGRWSAYAVHDGGGWASVMLWGAGRAWFPSASVTDLAEYVDAGGEMPERWYQAIRIRETEKAARVKARAACDRGTHPRAIERSGFMDCPDCDTAWPIGAAAPRKTKKGKGEAL